MGMIGEKELEEMRAVDIRTVDKDSLVDIEGIKIDGSLPRRERFADFLKKVGNPYCFRCGQVAVKVSFADTDVTLEERLVHYLMD